MSDKGEQVSGLSHDVCCLMVCGAVDKLDLVGLNHGAREVVTQVNVLELRWGAVLGSVGDAGLVVLVDGNWLLDGHS